MVKKIKNTPFWNVLRRGSAVTLALIVVAMSCFVPISAADEPTEPTEPVYSEGLAYSFSGTNATVTGPGTWTGGDLRIPPQVTVDGVTYSVTAIGNGAFYRNTNIYSVVLPVTVTSLGVNAFFGCSALNSFLAPDDARFSVGDYAFENCVSLRSFNFEWVTSIGSSPFDKCGLIDVVIPSRFSTFSLKYFGNTDLRSISYSFPTKLIYPSNNGNTAYEFIYYTGSFKDYLQSMEFYSYYAPLGNNVRLFVNGQEIAGSVVIPDGSYVGLALAGSKFITELHIPESVSFVSGTYVGYFRSMSALKNVYWYSDFGLGVSTNNNASTFGKCTALENFYYFGSKTSFDKNSCFYSTNNTFTFYLPGASDQYNLTGFTNPIVYNSAYVNLEATGLYTDDPLIFQKGSLFSMTLKTVFGYGLPGTVDVLDSAGVSLGWTNGVEYFYDSTNGAFSVPDLQNAITVVANGVSLVPNYYFFNANPAFQSFVGDQFTFEATDFNGSAVTGAFIRLEDERLCFYQIVADEDVLVWADDTGWVSPLYRYLDFGSYEVGEDLAYFLRTTASVPSIGSMLSQIYNASGGGSSGGSYEDGYTAGYNEGYNAGYAAGSSGAGTGSGSVAADSVLALATYRLDFIQGGQVVHSMNVTPQYNLGSVYFGAVDIVNAIYDYEEVNGDLDRVNVVCTWSDSDAFDFGQFPLYVTGTSLVETGSLLTSDDVSLSLEAPWVDGSSTQDLRRFEITSAEIPTVVLVKSVSIRVGRPQDLLNEFTLCTSTYFYNQGYSDGYTSGYGVGSSEVRTESYNTGYHNGFVEGKSEGITIAEKGNFYNLFFSVSDAVYSNFLNLLNFEVLGVNMKVVFGSFLTVCLVLIVIFKFTGKN